MSLNCRPGISSLLYHHKCYMISTMILDTLILGVSVTVTLLLLVSREVGGFQVVADTAPVLARREGESVNITCRSDNYYEYCGFTNPVGERCNFEWRRKEWNVTRRRCSELQHKVRFIGRYDRNECGIEIFGLTAQDY